MISFWQLPQHIQEDRLPKPFANLLTDTPYFSNSKSEPPKDRIKQALKLVRQAKALLKTAITTATANGELENILPLRI